MLDKEVLIKCFNKAREGRFAIEYTEIKSAFESIFGIQSLGWSSQPGQAKLCNNYESNPVEPTGGSWDQIWPPGPQKSNLGPGVLERSLKGSKHMRWILPAQAHGLEVFWTPVYEHEQCFYDMLNVLTETSLKSIH